MEATEAAANAPDQPDDSIDLDRLPDSVFAHAAEVVWVLVEDEVVVYHTPTSTSHVLNPSAGLLWRCVDGQSTLREILVDVADIFQVTVQDLIGQVVPVVAEWIDAELVEAEAPAP